MKYLDYSPISNSTGPIWRLVGKLTNRIAQYLNPGSNPEQTFNADTIATELAKARSVSDGLERRKDGRLQLEDIPWLCRTVDQFYGQNDLRDLSGFLGFNPSKRLSDELIGEFFNQYSRDALKLQAPFNPLREAVTAFHSIIFDGKLDLNPMDQLYKVDKTKFNDILIFIRKNAFLNNEDDRKKFYTILGNLDLMQVLLKEPKLLSYSAYKFLENIKDPQVQLKALINIFNAILSVRRVTDLSQIEQGISNFSDMQINIKSAVNKNKLSSIKQLGLLLDKYVESNNRNQISFSQFITMDNTDMYHTMRELLKNDLKSVLTWIVSVSLDNAFESAAMRTTKTIDDKVIPSLIDKIQILVQPHSLQLQDLRQCIEPYLKSYFSLTFNTKPNSDSITSSPKPSKVTQIQLLDGHKIEINASAIEGLALELASLIRKNLDLGS